MSLTTREKVLKYCKVSRRTRKGDNIEYGNRSFQMNRLFENVSDEDLEKVVKDKDLGIGAFIKEAETNEEKKVSITKARGKSAVESKPCECGCGEMTRKGSRFRPGHDMKLKSKLLKAAKDGDKAAEKELKSRGWA